MNEPFNKIIQAVTIVTGISYDEMRSKIKPRPIVEARQLAIYFIKKNTRINWVSLGKMFNRDHATAIFSVKQVETYIEVDKQIEWKVEAIKRYLGEKNKMPIKKGINYFVIPGIA